MKDRAYQNGGKSEQSSKMNDVFRKMIERSSDNGTLQTRHHGCLRGRRGESIWRVRGSLQSRWLTVPSTRDSLGTAGIWENVLEISKEWMYVNLVGRQACMESANTFWGSTYHLIKETIDKLRTVAGTWDLGLVVFGICSNFMSVYTKHRTTMAHTMLMMSMIDVSLFSF